MATRDGILCPNCQAFEGRPLEMSSQIANVDYYRCDRCGHVWTVPKAGKRGEPRDVTRRPKSDETP